ncbi:MAG: ribosomal protein S19 family protein, partial [Candidatus Dadabacteria bacterium]|nr:ribosomal protein S19 family protein [Candidatus Dadabacteria bacterium]
MPRSSKKGPFVSSRLLEKVQSEKAAGGSKIIRTWSRGSMVIPEMMGLTFAVYN